MPMPKKSRTPCLICGEEPSRAGYKYCGNVCQHEHQYSEYIKSWKKGKHNGLIALGVVSRHIKKYLRRKFGDKCCLCGWSKVNQKTGIIPLVADHVDGNWRNNNESNLRLICPNCDSLLPTYGALNKGNGRGGRMVSARVKEARMLRITETRVRPRKDKLN